MSHHSPQTLMKVDLDPKVERPTVTWALTAGLSSRLNGINNLFYKCGQAPWPL